MLLVPLRRVSSGEQVDGSGLQRQSDAAAAYAKTRGWTLHPETYSDEGVSGFSGANLDGDLGRFLSDLKRGHFGDHQVALGIEDIDRLSRQFTLSFLPVLVDDFLNAGVTISVMGKGRDISRESVRQNQMEIHELLFWMGGAHEFSDKLSKRITDHRDRLRQQIRDGKPTNPGKAPSWINLKGDQWVLNDYADTIRRVIEMSSSGMGAPTICKALNQEGIPSPGTMLKRRSKIKAKPTPWAPTVVLQILHSPALHGARAVAVPGHNARVRAWKEDCAHKLRQGVKPEELPEKPGHEMEPDQEDYFPALITAAEHDQLKLLLTRRRSDDAKGRTDQMRWIGARLTRCVCGAGLTTYSNKTRRGDGLYRYLRCNGKKDGSTNCKLGMVPLRSAQAHLLMRLTAESFTEMLREQSGENIKGQLAHFAERRTELVATIDSSKSKLQAGETAVADADDPAVLAVLAKRQVGLQEQLTAAYVALDSVEAELQNLQSTGSREQMAADAQAAVIGLLGRFALGTDEVADRRTVNDHLHRLGVQIILDRERMGLAFGDHEPDWNQMNDKLDSAALFTGLGMIGSRNHQFNPTPELQELLLAEAERTGNPVVDLGAAVIKLMEDDGQDISHLPESSRHWFVDTSADQS